MTTPKNDNRLGDTRQPIIDTNIYLMQNEKSYSFVSCSLGILCEARLGRCWGQAAGGGYMQVDIRRLYKSGN